MSCTKTPCFMRFFTPFLRFLAVKLAEIKQRRSDEAVEAPAPVATGRAKWQLVNARRSSAPNRTKQNHFTRLNIYALWRFLVSGETFSLKPELISLSVSRSADSKIQCGRHVLEDSCTRCCQNQNHLGTFPSNSSCN